MFGNWTGGLTLGRIGLKKVLLVGIPLLRCDESIELSVPAKAPIGRFIQIYPNVA
jgi:hypothetical protein